MARPLKDDVLGAFVRADVIAAPRNPGNGAKGGP